MAASQAQIGLEFNLAVRDYVARHVRPFAQEHVARDDFVPEVMSTSFASGEVFESVSKRFPDYILKFSSADPRNPKNQATPRELEIIRFFEKHPEVENWSGPLLLNGIRYQADFRARRMTESCLQCHGEPADAPASLLARYGDKAGFHRQLGEIVALDMVAVPIEHFERQVASLTWRNAVVVMVSLALLLGAVYVAFDLLVRRRLAAIAHHFRGSLEQSDPTRVAPIQRLADDEIGDLVDGFNRLAGRLSDVYGSMEQRVAERTSELETANQKLTHEAGERMQAQLELGLALAEAEKSNRVKREFLANVSHEIRTPMTAILGFSENLLDSNLDDAERRETVETIRRNGEHLLNLINDILDLSKVEEGKMLVEAIPCRPDEIVREVLASMRLRAQAKPLTLRARCAGPVPCEVLTDPTRLRQVLINLTGNAVKFTEQGRIDIVVSFQQGPKPVLEFLVSDTGIGMTVEQANSLFQPFTQADTSTARRFGGTGLGLALSRRLVELLGGRLELVSTELKLGSCFRATIPVSLVEGTRMVDSLEIALEPQSPSNRTSDSRFAAPCSVLLAEDGPDNQRMISLILRKAGAEVTIVENGHEAVLAAVAAGDAEPFDVILMDMQMPVLDGYEATGRLREAGYKGLIVALTAHAMAHDRQKCLDAGCDEYTSKPVDRNALITLLRDLVTRRAPVRS